MREKQKSPKSRCVAIPFLTAIGLKSRCPTALPSLFSFPVSFCVKFIKGFSDNSSPCLLGKKSRIPLNKTTNCELINTHTDRILWTYFSRIKWAVRKNSTHDFHIAQLSETESVKTDRHRLSKKKMENLKEKEYEVLKCSETTFFSSHRRYFLSPTRWNVTRQERQKSHWTTAQRLWLTGCLAHSSRSFLFRFSFLHDTRRRGVR